MRAEALLADIKSLSLNRSSWSDAQKLMTRWGRWGGWYGNCNEEDCSYSVRIYHLPLEFKGRLGAVVGMNDPNMPSLLTIEFDNGSDAEVPLGFLEKLPEP